MNNHLNNDENKDLSWSENLEESNFLTEEENDEGKKKSFFAIIKALSMMVLAFALLVFVGIAWFSMSNNVEISGMNVKTKASTFELAVPDTTNIGAKSYIQSGTGASAIDDSGTSLHDLPGGEPVGDGVCDTYTYITDVINRTTSSGSFYTTGSDDTIKWRLGSAYDKTSDGLGPSSYGDFLFYVVPKQAGTLNIKVKIELEGYYADVTANETGSYRVENLSRISSNHTSYPSVEYLNTHILFFTGRTGAGTEADPFYYTGLIDKDELNLTLENCEVDTLYPVHLYWIWPNTFAELTCIASNGNVSNSSGTVTDLRDYAIEKRAKFLKMNSGTALSYMADEVGGVYVFNPEKATNKLRELSIGYNDADQSIGTTVKYFLLVLTAE